MGSESKVAVVAALVANLLIAVMKLGAGILASSTAMLAEAAHSFSDVGNQVLLMIGMSRGDSTPTSAYPFGRGKNAFFWPFMVAVLLFGFAGAYSLLEGFEKIRHPEAIGDIRISLIVLGVAFVIEIASLAIAIREVRKAAARREITSVKQFLKENRDATMLTVLVEDGLALAGLPVAAVALIAAKMTGNAVWDGVGSLMIGAMLMGFAVFLGHEVRALLVGRGLSERDLNEVHATIEEEAAIQAVLSVQSMYVGPESVVLGVQVDYDDALTAREVEEVGARLVSELKARVPVLRFVFVGG